jgi:hypothetical protein
VVQLLPLHPAGLSDTQAWPLAQAVLSPAAQLTAHSLLVAPPSIGMAAQVRPAPQSLAWLHAPPPVVE